MRFSLRTYFIVVTLLCVILSQTMFAPTSDYTNLWFNFPPTGHRLHIHLEYPHYSRSIQVMIGSTAEDGTPYCNYDVVYSQIFWLKGENGDDYWWP